LREDSPRCHYRFAECRESGRSRTGPPEDPRRLTAQTEAIAQAGRRAHADGIEGVEAIPYVTSHISAEIQSQVARKLETVVHTYIASPRPVISHVGGAIGIGEIAVINKACLRLDAPFAVNRTRNEHEEN